MNSVAVAGVIVGQWRYGADHFIRLSVERTPGLPVRGEGEGWDGRSSQPDLGFVTIRLPLNMFGDLSSVFGEGQLVELIGHTQNADGSGDPSSFSKRARILKPQTIWRR